MWLFLRSFTELFNARIAYFCIITWVVCWQEKRGGGFGLTLLPSHPPLFASLRHSETKQTPPTPLVNPSRIWLSGREIFNTRFTRLQTAGCPRQQFACFHTHAHTQTHAHTLRHTHTLLLFSPRSPLRAAPPTTSPVHVSSIPFPLSYTPR